MLPIEDIKRVFFLFFGAQLVVSFIIKTVINCKLLLKIIVEN